ncbi:hypothetical protein ACN27F_00350 [Solwaraspora sp. WMMB335]|uniref:hypothetical protein n=1 Tax=Solwaraspora sp. WMMB335 TaxID=3404118 RepID=UPI003B957088
MTDGAAGAGVGSANVDPPELNSVEAVFREEHGRLLATLARQFGDLDLAEEAALQASRRRSPAAARPGPDPRRPGR